MTFGLPHTPVSSKIDIFVTKLSKLFSWFWAVVVVVIATTIAVRYGAAKLDIQTNSYLLMRLLSSVFWEELTWYLYGWAWLIGLSFVIVTDEHVRVDVIHEKLGKTAQVWIEVLGILFLLLPMLVAVLVHGLDFALSSFRDGEGSQQIGLDFVWIVKFAIPLTFFVSLMACISRLLKCFAWIRSKSATGWNPFLLSAQLAAAGYLGFIFYNMYVWSLDMEPMTIFRILGI